VTTREFAVAIHEKDKKRILLEGYFVDDDALYNDTHPIHIGLDRVIRKTAMAQRRWWDMQLAKVHDGTIDEYTEQIYDSNLLKVLACLA
jgi:hypothetical protein